MKKLILTSIIALMTFAGTAHADLVPLSDDELATVTGQQFRSSDFVKGLQEDLQRAALDKGSAMTTEEIFRQLAKIATVFGANFEDITINGMRFDGSSSLSMKANGVTTTLPLPSYIDNMTFGLRFGDGPRVGVVEIQGLHMSGTTIKIELR